MNVPKLRFKEFKDEWQEKKFNKCFLFLQNNTFSRNDLTEDKTDVKNIHYGDILTKYRTTLNLKNNDIPFIKKEIDLTKFRLESYLQTGDIIIADTAEDYTVGKAIEIYNDDNFKVLAGLHTFACRPINKFARGYLGEYINSNSFHSKLIPFITGTKVSSISKSSINEIGLFYPSIQEQEKIANFLSSVDKKIELTEDKLEAFKEYKKGVMQKIFSQEIRFKDENGNDYPEWEEKKLGDLVNSISSGKSKNMKISVGLYPLYGSTGKIGNIDSYDYEGENILIARVGANAGTINFINSRCGISDNTLVTSVKKNNINRWLYYYLVNFNLNKIIFGTGQPLITGSQLKKLDILLPSLQEQEKIANFLSAIDEKIEKIENSLNELKEFKKGLLQQMFV